MAIITLTMEHFDALSVVNLLHNHAFILSAHGDEDNAKECAGLKEQIRRQIQEQLNGGENAKR